MLDKKKSNGITKAIIIQLQYVFTTFYGNLQP